MNIKNRITRSEQQTKEQLHNIKDRLLDMLYWIFTVFMWFALAASLFRSLVIGWHTYNYIQLLCLVIFLIIFLARKKIEYKARAFFFLGIIYLLGTIGIYANGLLSTGIYFLLLFTIISGILTNRKWGVTAFTIALLTLFILAILDINGYTPNYATDTEYTKTYNSWIMTILVFTLVTFVIVLFWIRILNFLIKIISDSHETTESLNKLNKLLSKEIESRKHAEIQLKKQINETNQVNKDFIKLHEKLKNSNTELERSNVLLAEAKQKAQEADKLKSSFLSNMSHEIRTPMNAIVGFATLMASTEITKEDNYKYLNIIQSSTHNLINIINDILTMAKIDSGQFTLYPGLINLSEFADDIQERYTREVFVQKDNAVQFEIENDFSEKAAIIADLESLIQITNKLIDNAIKFTREGFVKVKISLFQNCFLLINIDDSGIGIPNDIKNEIFETFRQIDLGNTRRYGGTGIGLSIAKGLVNLLNGTIELNSRKDKGTSFNIRIPVINKSPSIKDVEINSNFSLKGKTILIVGKITWDDRSINETLQDINAILIYVETGYQAIDTLKEHPEIDIAIISLFLPDMNSIETNSLLRKVKNELPIFAHSASSNSDTPLGFDKEKWEYIIDNPFNKQEFLITLKKHS